MSELPDDYGYAADPYDWLNSFEGEYRPEHAFRRNFDTLADGDYDFEVTDARLDKVNADDVLRLGLRTHAGAQVEYTYWLNRQQGVNGLCADLLTLGFDTNRWGRAAGRPLSQELPRAVAKLPGLRFRGTKKTRPGREPNKAFHDLYVNARLAGAPMPPGSPAAAVAAPPAAQPAPAPANGPPAWSSDDIPF